MEKQAFRDVFPIENGGISSLPMLVYFEILRLSASHGCDCVCVCACVCACCRGWWLRGMPRCMEHGQLPSFAPHLTRARKENCCSSPTERIEKNETEGGRLDPFNEILDLKGCIQILEDWHGQPDGEGSEGSEPGNKCFNPCAASHGCIGGCSMRPWQETALPSTLRGEG